MGVNQIKPSMVTKAIGTYKSADGHRVAFDKNGVTWRVSPEDALAIAKEKKAREAGKVER